jgi:hypothetical protein
VELSVAVLDMRDSLVKTIGANAFDACPGLQRVFLSRVTETIGQSAFYECEELGEVISVPRSLRTIGAQSFHITTSLTLEIDDGVPQGERQTRELRVRQARPIGNVTHINVAAYSIRGGRDSIDRVNLDGMDAGEAWDRPRPSSACLLL